MESRQALYKTKPPSLCYAPFGGLHFRQDGCVYACCMSKHPLGNLQNRTLDDIWRGARIREMRAALSSGRLALGCDICAKFLADGDHHNAPMRYFDGWTPTADWPTNLDFQLSNKCNLQCLMCNGLSSSSIRLHRDHEPPIMSPYSDAILAGMAEFIAHAGYLRFSGGEPFLIREYYKIWDMVANAGTAAKTWDGPGTKCQLTTNATQWHHRIEHVLDRLSMGIDVSMDGASRATVETIRVGIDYDRFIANAWRFREYARERKTYFLLSMCFMPQNWFELGAMCLRADEWDCDLNCNFVVSPREHSVLRQPVECVREILDGMDGETRTLEHQLRRNRNVWFTALTKVRARAIALGG